MATTFNEQVKQELSHLPTNRPCCRLAELAGFAQVASVLSLRGAGRFRLVFACEAIETAEKMMALLRNVGGEVALLESVQRSGRAARYEWQLEGDAALALQLGILQSADPFELSEGIPERFLQAECDRRSLLRGAFLGAGYVADPQRRYHLEVSVLREAVAHALQKGFEIEGFPAKIVVRKDRFMVYLKEGERISDLLAALGANRAVLDFENTRVLRDIAGKVNRSVNCETANSDKRARTAARQLQNIRLIENTIGLAKLPDVLEEIARIRLDNPEATLEELGELITPPLGKSGVNHRLRRIDQIARTLKQP